MITRNIFRKSAIIVLVITAATILLVNNSSYFWKFIKSRPFGFDRYFAHHHYKPRLENESLFHIDTEGCKIPRTPIKPEYFKNEWHVTKIPDCDYEKLLSKLDDTNQILTLLPEYENSKCCLAEVFREEKDKLMDIGTCQPLTQSANVSGKEMLMTKCGMNLNFEANIPINPTVQKKIDFWKFHQSSNSKPISILFFGIDSVSRSHAYRSLPKFTSSMKKMGFLDFPGYHSVAASTLTTFMAFLMGLSRKKVRKQCSPDWISPFDSCPFIWKEFGDINKYVTLYLEDGEQTFNWGGQSGFRRKPTDYYIHALFNSLMIRQINSEVLSRRSSYMEKIKHIPCASNETIPQFVLRYTRRFIQKFQQQLNVPYFAFTWLAYPYHDFMFSVQTLDEDLTEFMKILNSSPGFLDNTLIIFLSDHGDRTTFFNSNQIDAFIERGLPPLFLRIPEKFKISHPELNLDKVVQENTKALISPFDLHHTFLHILAISTSLNISKISSEHFDPEGSDRKSLLIPMNPTRTCAELNIESLTCVCSTSAQAEPIKNPLYLTKIIEFATKQLNQIVKTSKYANLCETWETNVDGILLTQILHQMPNYTDALLHFSANSVKAHFGVKIKIIHGNSDFDGCQLISDFIRINNYGNQSYCVEFRTDDDKEMTQFCLCKPREVLNKLFTAL